MRSIFRSSTALCILLCISSTTLACNIPVFRYALERWKPDECEMIVFVRGELPLDLASRLASAGFDLPGEQATPEQLEQKVAAPVGRVRVSVCDVSRFDDSAGGENDSVAANTWSTLLKKSQRPIKLPYGVVRAPTRKGPIEAWSGTLDQASLARLVQSPVRQELAQRLLSGHSIVWLLVEGDDTNKTRRLQSQLLANGETLSRKLKLPEGIGLPGSELFSDLPLWVKFSVLRIDRNDPKEKFLVNLLGGLQPDAFADGTDLLVPVFGRGRALEVIPVESLSDNLVEDIARFLCAACSCQVKDQNPGFDLLLSVDWNRQLFGEDGALPPSVASQPAGLTPTPAKKLLIPPGKRNSGKSK
ncbi:MAG: hypothetical protein Aurels2KO_05260 [Aureliella sp.]